MSMSRCVKAAALARSHNAIPSEGDTEQRGAEHDEGWLAIGVRAPHEPKHRERRHQHDEQFDGAQSSRIVPH